MYSTIKHETICLGFGSLLKYTRCKSTALTMGGFLFVLISTPISLWAGASADALGRAGYRVGQSSNPLDTRPPYLEVRSGGNLNPLHGGTRHE